MFEELFDRPLAIARHRHAPMLEERVAFLQHQASRDMARDTLRLAANYMLSICNELNLSDRTDKLISLLEIKEAAKLCSGDCTLNGRNKAASLDAQRRFTSCATQWLRFMDRLYVPPKSPHPYAQHIDAYAAYQLSERGLSPQTIATQCWTVRDFLSRLAKTGQPLSEVTITTIDSVLMAKIEEASYARVSIRNYATSLRSFFRYAGAKGWCQTGLAEGIRAARVFPQERLPNGPCWADVQRLLTSTEDEHPTNVRDRAIILLLAVYGMRAGEVIGLRLEDFNWDNEQLSVRRSKSRDAQLYPLSITVGNAVLRYIVDVRPTSSCREVFLTRSAPFRPLTSLWRIVASRLRPMGIPLSHYGPHALRHACATYLLAQGFTMKEIGDHLGHHDPEATRIYAKVDLVGLRRVAEFDLGDVL